MTLTNGTPPGGWTEADRVPRDAVVVAIVEHHDATGPRYDIDVTPADGNVFSIMGATRKALRRAGASQAELDEYTAEVTSGDYDHALQVTMRWVNLDA